jgi:hypothetical protein
MKHIFPVVFLVSLAFGGLLWADAGGQTQQANILTGTGFYSATPGERFATPIKSMSMSSKHLPLPLMGVAVLPAPSWTWFSGHDGTSIDNVVGFTLKGWNDQNIAIQQPPFKEAFPGTSYLSMNEFPVTYSGTYSDALSMSSVELSHIKVGIDLLMLENEVGPNELYGVGLLFKFTSPIHS